MPRSRSPWTLALALVLGATACHSNLRYQDTRRGETRHERRDGPPRALPPAVQVTDSGRLRFVEPLVCATDTVTEMASFDVDRSRPNAATLIVGLISVGVGVVAGATGLASDDAAGSPLTYVGAAGVAVGLPLVIGPLIGNTVERHPTGVQEVRRPGDGERCGERPVTAERATLLWSGLRAEGAVEADGTFARSPFEFVDAFDIGRLPALALAIDLVRPDGVLRLEAVVDASELARARDGFFASRGLDGTVIPVAAMRKVPQLDPGQLAVTLAPGPALRVSLPIDNVGPGDAYGVRLLLSSSSPELDGRIVYLGRVAAHAHAVFDAVFPISAEAARALDGTDATFSALVRDAHDTAPSTPVRFRGPMLRTVP